MSHGQFFVTTTNPNDTTGGCGCICSPEKQIDCAGPYAVAPSNEMESIASPHVVIGAKCIRRLVELLDGEILAAGEKSNGEGVANYDFELDEDGLPKV